ncbi:hypothetical protein [Clostridium lacusfryxellense]|uniref:hypothetical protein n=1 Tax=Clostridium lacusfryxellense TaxID=205328 RepID=UPI001C0E1BE7|nr:hypothetical protein [Clostridium lacusfryxellense]MBU3110335.1 hypothetical protein [Clostridium lacusfryxellense]
MKIDEMLSISVATATQIRMVFDCGMIEKLSRNSTSPVTGDVGKLIFIKNKNP